LSAGFRQTSDMRIKLTSIMVDDQDKALKFYTEVLGFVKRHDIPVGEYRWITVASQEEPTNVELALEPNANPAGKAFQEALFKQGIPATAFEVGDIEQEHRRLENRSVVFTQTPTPQGPVTIAIFADTCGNLIQLYEPPAADGTDV
jgi:catechol 2,3-dioxygenase-like lactoylglutathione lyase family enzyme